MALTFPAELMGLMVSGDVAGMTIYTDRYNRKVVYPKSPPKEPPTMLQRRTRDKFKLAQKAYMLLDPGDKQLWEILVQTANLCMTGQNLFIHTAIRHDFDVLQTIIRQTGVTVTPPNPV